MKVGASEHIMLSNLYTSQDMCHKCQISSRLLACPAKLSLRVTHKSQTQQVPDRMHHALVLFSSSILKSQLMVSSFIPSSKHYKLILVPLFPSFQHSQWINKFCCFYLRSVSRIWSFLLST